jgi:glycosyltransferase involved in cell wall biosynthesis
VCMPVRVAYVVGSWPRLSQTFVLGEVLALERIGVAVSIFAMTKPDEGLVQPRVADVRAPVRYLDSHAWENAAGHLRVAVGSPRRYVATLVYSLARRELRGGYTQSGALAAFNKAVLVADGLEMGRRKGQPFSHVHAHFAHDPTLIGLLAHRLTGLPFSFTAHARDLYQIPGAALAGRAREAGTIVTCCRANVDHIEGVLGDTDPPVELIYHGVDLQMFGPAPRLRRHTVPVVLSVGRLVEKKGFDDLLAACALVVATGRDFTCEIYGDGPCRDELEALRDRLGLEAVVRFRGERTQVELVAVYQNADVFALTPRITDDGDRDGVPNVLVEAMACSVPIVATDVGGISELVRHGTNGLLAPARDVDALAAHLGELLDDAGRRRRLGQAAADTATRFDGQAAARHLAVLFGHDSQAVS